MASINERKYLLPTLIFKRFGLAYSLKGLIEKMTISVASIFDEATNKDIFLNIIVD